MHVCYQSLPAYIIDVWSWSVVGDYQPQSYCQFLGQYDPLDYSIMLPELSVSQLSVVKNYALQDNRRLVGLHTLRDRKENWKGLEFGHISECN